MAPRAADRGRRRSRLYAALVTSRPRQWVKNALVIGAPGAAGALTRHDVPARVALAFVAFCLLASGAYALNDVRDAAEDRRHPRKRRRPVAAGELEPRSALALGVGLMLAGLVCCALVRPALAAIGAAYLALTLSYTLIWRRIVIADVVAIAAGFVLRAVAGGVAAPVPLSRWFLLVVISSAVFVAAGKRHAELIRSGTSRPSSRRVLTGYSARSLRLLLTVSAVVALIGYALWAAEQLAAHDAVLQAVSVIPFAACLRRYSVLLAGGAGESPEEILYGDRRLQLLGLIWILTFALGVHAAP